VLLASLKIGTIVVIVVAGVLFGKQNANEAAPLVSPLGMGTVRALPTALVAATWAYNLAEPKSLRVKNREAYVFGQRPSTGPHVASPAEQQPRVPCAEHRPPLRHFASIAWPPRAVVQFISGES